MVRPAGEALRVRHEAQHEARRITDARDVAKRAVGVVAGVVTDGDLLEIATQVKFLIINGADVGLDNKHLELYEKYRARPKP